MAATIPSVQTIQYLGTDIKFQKTDTETTYLLPTFTDKEQFFDKIAQVFAHVKAPVFQTMLLAEHIIKNPTYENDPASLPIEVTQEFGQIQNIYINMLKNGLDLKFKMPINAHYKVPDFKAASKLYLIFKNSTGQFSVCAPNEALQLDHLFTPEGNLSVGKRQIAEEILGKCYDIYRNNINLSL